MQAAVVPPPRAVQARPEHHAALAGAGRHAHMGMDLSQAAYRYNQNMMEYYTCKTRRNMK